MDENDLGTADLGLLIWAQRQHKMGERKPTVM